MKKLDAGIRREILALQKGMVKTRRDLHRHPELGFEEERTGAMVRDRLAAIGYEVERVAGTGVVGLLRAGGASSSPRTLAVRADMDALPLDEEGDKPYKSLNPGKMHACGHDGHTAILLGFAEYMAAKKESLPGHLKLLFQPAEEGPGGAKPMIEAGVLEDPRVDCVIGLHLWNNLPAGQVAIKAGTIMASADEFIITILGKGGHGAMPHQTVDAVAIMAQVICALQTIVSRNLDPLDSVVLSVGEAKAGSNFNIIAQEALVRGTVRTLKPELRVFMRERIEQVAGGVCKSLGADYRYQWREHYPATVNDAEVAAMIAECAGRVVGKENVIQAETTMGAEDMSYFLNAAGGAYFFLGSAAEQEGLNKPHHHPGFDFDEGVMPIGVEIFARFAEKFFGGG